MSDSSQQQIINGVLERILFFNEENAYCVAEISVAQGQPNVTILGNLPGVQCGETLKIHGQWTRHPTHGEQFKVASFQSELPASVHGIRKYLGSGMVRGIGQSYAEKIVNYFGSETLRVISEDSGRLHEVPGIGKARAKSIKAAWEEQAIVRNIMVFLQTYGVTPTQCVRLVKKYGNHAQRILQDEPYRLAKDIDRIGFKTADKLALNLGFPSYSKERIDAGILHILQELEDDGHTLGTEQTIIEHAIKLLDVAPNLIQNRIRTLIQNKELNSVNADGGKQQTPEPACQHPRLAEAEKRIARAFRRIHTTKSTLPKIQIEAAIHWAQEKTGFPFANQQTAALKQILQSKVAILTGGPGTGKTTILKAIADIIRAKNARMKLASPTGRAAQRLAEATGVNAGTIHRLLKYDGATRTFVHNEENPLPCDLLIVDEASMLDTRLAANLFDAIPSTAHLLLVGDADQLPSVGSGNVLGDLMATPSAQVTRLNTIFRQGKNSGIITTAHAILKGEVRPDNIITSLHDLNPELDFTFIKTENPEQCTQAITYLAREYIPKTDRIDPIRELQVLSPMHRGTGGISALNTALQESLNSEETALKRQPTAPVHTSARQIHFREKNRKPRFAELTYGTTKFRIGDKVIQTRNNYDKGIFNGDTGIIQSIAPDGSGLTIDFSNQLVEFMKGELSEVQLAYAISIHKSQGSEYPVVVIPLLKQHFMMLQRNLLYTGITRARRKVYLVGSVDAYSMAVRNNKTKIRRTHLQARLHNTEHP